MQWQKYIILLILYYIITVEQKIQIYVLYLHCTEISMPTLHGMIKMKLTEFIQPLKHKPTHTCTHP